MKRNYLNSILFLVLLGSCSKEDEIDAALLISAPSTIAINNENYSLNGFVADYGDRIVTVAELMKENQTKIDASIEIIKISLVKNDQVYQSSSLDKMDPTDTFSLVSKAEDLPSWVLDPAIQMVIEIKAANELFLLKDSNVEI